MGVDETAARAAAARNEAASRAEFLRATQAKRATGDARVSEFQAAVDAFIASEAARDYPNVQQLTFRQEWTEPRSLGRKRTVSSGEDTYGWTLYYRSSTDSYDDNTTIHEHITLGLDGQVMAMGRPVSIEGFVNGNGGIGSYGYREALAYLREHLD